MLSSVSKAQPNFLLQQIHLRESELCKKWVLRLCSLQPTREFEAVRKLTCFWFKSKSLIVNCFKCFGYFFLFFLFPFLAFLTFCQLSWNFLMRIECFLFSCLRIVFDFPWRFLVFVARFRSLRFGLFCKSATSMGDSWERIPTLKQEVEFRQTERKYSVFVISGNDSCVNIRTNCDRFQLLQQPVKPKK